MKVLLMPSCSCISKGNYGKKMGSRNRQRACTYTKEAMIEKIDHLYRRYLRQGED